MSGLLVGVLAGTTEATGVVVVVIVAAAVLAAGQARPAVVWLTRFSKRDAISETVEMDFGWAVGLAGGGLAEGGRWGAGPFGRGGRARMGARMAEGVRAAAVEGGGAPAVEGAAVAGGHSGWGGCVSCGGSGGVAMGRRKAWELPDARAFLGGASFDDMGVLC